MNTLHVFGLGSLLTGHHVERDLIAGLESFESLAQDAGIMNKDILPRFLGNEPEALRVIPPFDFATRHSAFLLNLRGARNPENYGPKPQQRAKSLLFWNRVRL